MAEKTNGSGKQPLQDPFLNQLRKQSVPVSMFLVNGIKLQGVIVSFDQYVIMLEKGNIVQMVYKHAVSTIVPAHAVNFKQLTGLPQDDQDE